ncbi:hypothetical protein [Pseudofrankia sp. BMG5.37]|uniref:hypothetical protein n=1 Tax=Pseudofrankia sp. BMG5.37 TaxID=3050035 RepID=UPI00289410B7|nr:hypothetical protein [Pseudofrankia sp. BMG5.37]MDT3444468.1 hypothetical protein [Pseudofrankia sp. BMG5.37]
MPEPDAPSWPAELVAADPGVADGLDADTADRGSGRAHSWWSGASTRTGWPQQPVTTTGPAESGGQEPAGWAALDPPGHQPTLTGGALAGPPVEEVWTPPRVERWWLERLVAAMLVVTLLAASLLCAVVIWRLLNPPPVRVCLPQPAAVYECGATGGDGLWSSATPPAGPLTASASACSGFRRASPGSAPPRQALAPTTRVG